MKSEANIWRLDKIVVNLSVPLGDSDFLETLSRRLSAYGIEARESVRSLPRKLRMRPLSRAWDSPARSRISAEAAMDSAQPPRVSDDRRRAGRGQLRRLCFFSHRLFREPSRSFPRSGRARQRRYRSARFLRGRIRRRPIRRRWPGEHLLARGRNTTLATQPAPCARTLARNSATISNAARRASSALVTSNEIAPTRACPPPP
jgi:hypothetical protein